MGMPVPLTRISSRLYLDDSIHQRPCSDVYTHGGVTAVTAAPSLAWMLVMVANGVIAVLV